MKCLIPKENSLGVFHSCKKCQACKINQAKKQATVIKLAIKHAALPSYFVTVTYNDHWLPSNKEGTVASLRYSEIQEFTRKLKKEQKQMKYFTAAEYGSTTGRPHYHLIMINYLMPNDLKPITADGYQKNLFWSATITKTWKKGNVIIAPATAGSAEYVTGYVVKKMGHDWKGRPEKLGIENERHTMSPGLALPAWKKWIKEAIDNGANDAVNIDSRTEPIPDYFKYKTRRELGHQVPALKPDGKPYKKTVGLGPDMIQMLTDRRLTELEEYTADDAKKEYAYKKQQLNNLTKKRRKI